MAPSLAPTCSSKRSSVSNQVPVAANLASLDPNPAVAHRWNPKSLHFEGKGASVVAHKSFLHLGEPHKSQVHVQIARRLKRL